MARKPKPVIPQTADELTPDWFSSTLGHDARVTDVATTVIGTDIGFMGEIYRCDLTWDTNGADDSDLPASIVVKAPSIRPENRALAEGLRAFEREIEVYQTLSGTLGIPMPAHHFSTMDPDPAPWLERPIIFLLEKLPIGAVNWIGLKFLKFAEKSTRRYVLVIEDIADARPPTQVAGGSLADSEVALRVLARFHASNWMDQDAVDASNRIWPLNTTPKIMQAGYRRNRGEFVAEWGERIGADKVARLDHMQQNLPEISDRLCEPPWTIIHGDYRLDNVLFRAGDDVVVIDYQMVGWARPGYDVAYFITTALTPEHRAEEIALLRVYHDELVGAGVNDYSWNDLLVDCGLSKTLLAHRFVGGRDALDTQLAGVDQSFLDLLTTRVMGWMDS